MIFISNRLPFVSIINISRKKDYHKGDKNFPFTISVRILNDRGEAKITITKHQKLF